MRGSPVVAGFVLAALASAVPAPVSGEDGASEVAAMFRERCASCHSVPDPALRPDRAWLDQIRRTA